MRGKVQVLRPDAFKAKENSNNEIQKNVFAF